MYTKRFIFGSLVLLISGETYSYILNKNIDQTDCKNICANAEGRSEFNAKTKMCKCLLSKHLDDVDRSLINKNAQLFGNTRNEIERFKEDKIVKRDVSEINSTSPQTTLNEQPSTKENIIETTTVSGFESEDKTDSDLNPEGIVGQATPNRRRTQRPTPRRPRDSRPITLEQQRIISQQINDHLNRLNQISDQRLRELEIEAIRNNLRQLSHTSLLPQQRSRIRTVAEERRKIIKPRLLHSRIVAAPFPNFMENSTEKEGLHNKKLKFFEIITQDPRLVDE